MKEFGLVIFGNSFITGKEFKSGEFHAVIDQGGSLTMKGEGIGAMLSLGAVEARVLAEWILQELPSDGSSDNS